MEFDERLVIGIVYLILGVLVIYFAPQYVDLYILIATPILSYYFAKITVAKKIEKKPKYWVSDVLIFIACMLIVFLAVLLYCWALKVIG